MIRRQSQPYSTSAFKRVTPAVGYSFPKIGGGAMFSLAGFERSHLPDKHPT